MFDGMVISRLRRALKRSFRNYHTATDSPTKSGLLAGAIKRFGPSRSSSIDTKLHRRQPFQITFPQEPVQAYEGNFDER